jgi:hypothetical protein
MKKKRILLLPLVLAVLLALLMAGCTEKKPEPPDADGGNYYSDMANDLAQRGYIQPGANIREYTDENGNRGIEYENPDGSGGGGVVVD